MYLVTALVPSLTVCLANSPANNNRTDVWTSRLEIVDRQLCCDNFDDSLVIPQKLSLTKEFMMLIALFEIPVDGLTLILCKMA